jgi:glycosyltransferase involved in cell wall biosynthesis
LNETIETGTPRFSVIIPAYNQARYLGEAIKSVLAQTFHDYEIVVVNDGSTDETEMVALRYDEKIRYVYQENQGLAGARNSGIRAAQGAWIALLDSDDCWLPEFLERMTARINEHPRAVVFYGAALCVDERGVPLKQAVGYKPVENVRLYHALLRANFIIPSTVVVNKKVIEQAGCFDQSLRSCEDWDLWLQLLSEGKAFYGIPDVLVHYRIHGSSLSANVARMQNSHRSVAEKHFGVDDRQYDQWAEEKRIAFGGLYRYQLLTNIQRRNDWQGADILQKAMQADPSITTDLDFYFELALGSQPVGYRGTDCQLMLAQNAQRIESLLADLFALADNPEILKKRDVIYGSAYKAIGLAAYNTGQFALCRMYLWKAFRNQPGLWREGWIFDRLLKSLFGRRIRERWRKLRSRLKTKPGSA